MLAAAPVVDWDVQSHRALSGSELVGLRGCNSHLHHLMAGAGHSSSSNPLLSSFFPPVKPLLKSQKRQRPPSQVAGAENPTLFSLQRVCGGLKRGGSASPSTLGGFAGGALL